MLPANGAPLLPKVMTMRTLADNFHDHVVARTKDNWRYWVFVNIMGHFVHSFDQQVAATTFEEIQTTSLEYIGNNLSLQQLRKGTFAFNYNLLTYCTVNKKHTVHVRLSVEKKYVVIRFTDMLYCTCTGT